MAFQVGDRVQILDEEGEGVITGFLGRAIALVDLGDFQFEYPITELIRVDEDNNLVHKAHERDFEKLLNSSNPQKVKEVLQFIPIEVFDKVSRAGYPEIDLHIHELVDKPKTLTNSEMLEIQIHRLERFIMSCSHKSVTEFVVIHGVGEGVLRTEVRKVLSSHGNISFQDASYHEYGYGATYAKIRGIFT